MRVTTQRGFTIIETMLFLAVTGLLTIGILVGASTAISAQRYKDAVATLQSDIQQQYEDTLSVKNGRSGASTIPACAGNRGQTDCVLMGKLMTISSGGAIVYYDIYGREPGTLTGSPTEYQIMQAYNPAVVPSSDRSGAMEWGTGIAWPVSGAEASTAPRDIGILIIRSPESGTAYTFTRNTTSTANLSSMINGAARGKRTLCISPAGWVVSDRMTVTIAAGASTAGAIEIRSNQLIPDTELVC